MISGIRFLLGSGAGERTASSLGIGLPLGAGPGAGEKVPSASGTGQGTVPTDRSGRKGPPAGSDVLIRIEDVSKVYQRDTIRIPVLTDVDLEVARGDFLALMGPSGSGKSTLLNLIAGIDRPSSGRIIVGGSDIARLSDAALTRWRSRHVGFIFQMYNLVPVLTAFENVELPLLLTRLSRRERREHVLAALEMVGLSDRVKHYPRQLSGGQEQRVAIARAIVTDPTLLVADEPTGDLDHKSAEEILDLLAMLNRDLEKTIVMVTHDPKAAAHAHKVLHLDKGELTNGDGA